MMYQRISSPAFFIGRGSTPLTTGGSDLSNTSGQARQLISFGSGQPDIPPPQKAYEALASYKGHKYGLIQGEESLRIAIAAEYPNASAEQIVVTNGCSEALDLVLRALSEEGGRVALPRPYYYSYPHNVELAGMTPVYYDLVDGKIDFEVFESVTIGCRAVIINSPSNPTGTVQEVETLKKVEQFCDRHGIYILSDEVYKDLLYVRENYLLTGERVVTMNSFSKTYSMCGFRLGYFHTLDHSLVEKVVEMKSHTSMNTSVAVQMMGLAAMGERAAVVPKIVPIWRERRDYIYDGMKKLGLDVWKPEGAFYILPKLKDSGRVVSDLFYKYDMITYDGAWFGAPGRVRFSYALDTKKIEEGLRRLEQFLKTEHASY